MIEFEITGKPVPMPRPRFTKVGRTYNPPQAQMRKKEIGIIARNEMIQRAVEITDSAVELEIECYFEPPQSYTLKKLSQISKGHLKYIKKPDVDNLAKTIMDALNKVVYHDDSQIVKLTITKIYSDEARTVVRVKEV